jgi:hypothetical protein
MVIVPAFIIGTILNAPIPNDLTAIFGSVACSIYEHIQTNPTDLDIATTFGPILQFLWLAAQPVPALFVDPSAFTRNDSVTVVDAANDLAETLLQRLPPPPTGNEAPPQDIMHLLTNISAIRDQTDTSNRTQSPQTDSKKQGFHRLSDLNRIALLRASIIIPACTYQSTSFTPPPLTDLRLPSEPPNDDYRSFLLQDKDDALRALQDHFAWHQATDIHINRRIALLFWTGQFFAAGKIMEEWLPFLSVFYFAPKASRQAAGRKADRTPLAQDEWDARADCRLLTKEQVNANLNLEPFTSAGYNNVKSHLRNVREVLKFVLGPESAPYHFLNTWYNWLDHQNGHGAQDAFNNDIEFGTLVLTRIEWQLHQFFRSCKAKNVEHAQNLTTIEYKALNSTQDFANIELGDFGIRNLPAMYRDLTKPYKPKLPPATPAAPNAPGDDDDAVTPRQPNKRRKTDKDPHPADQAPGNTPALRPQGAADDINQLAIPSWLAAARDGLAPFHMARDKPRWDGVEICLRFHLRGACNKSCPRIRTHMKLPPEITQQFETWCQGVKAKVE